MQNQGIHQLKAGIILALLSTATPSFAQVPPPPKLSVQANPKIAEKVGITQRLENELPLDTPFVDENGKAVQLGDYFKEKPVVLAFVYYECPMLCTLILNGAMRALKAVSLKPGQDYDVVAISFDHREAPLNALEKKKAYLQEFGMEGSNAGWHFLTGQEADIKSVADAAGFRFAWDDERQEYAHASGIMVTTPEGKMAQYFYGVEYSARDLQLAMVESSSGKVGSLVDQVMLYCYHYDPMTGRYGVVITRVLQIFGTLILLLLAAFIGSNLLRDKRRESEAHAQGRGGDEGISTSSAS